MGIRYYLHAGISGSGSTAYIAAYRDLRLPADVHTITNNKTDKTTVSKLSGKKKYYVRVRSYTTVKGTKYYGAWSASKSVTTKK